MKIISRFIHYLILKSGFDDIITEKYPGNLFFNKLIPGPTEYKNGTIKEVTRNKIRYHLEVNDYMQWYIYAGFEDTFWKECLDYIMPDSTVLDIGANVGAFSLKCALYCHENNYRAQIVAFEPNTLIFEKLNLNISLNKALTELIKCEKLALKENPGPAGFSVDNNNSGHGKLSAKVETFQVNCTTIDDYASAHPTGIISLVKIDVEGLEPLVIKGGMETIKKCKPVLLIEVTDEWYSQLGYSETYMKKILRDLGYRLYTYNGKYVSELTDLNESGAYQFNMMCIPTELK